MTAKAKQTEEEIQDAYLEWIEGLKSRIEALEAVNRELVEAVVESLKPLYCAIVDCPADISSKACICGWHSARCDWFR